ncbi:UNVERIFIED_ORG: hypothetical protein ABRZ91_001820 [Heyndrickxia coagulans]
MKMWAAAFTQSPAMLRKHGKMKVFLNIEPIYVKETRKNEDLPSHGAAMLRKLEKTEVFLYIECGYVKETRKIDGLPLHSVRLR